MKKSSIVILIIILLELLLTPLLSYASFSDINYPPNNKGKADYTDEEADKEKLETKTKSPEEYIGKSSNNYLKSLVVENARMEPEFHRQYVDYQLTLEKQETKTINIIAEAEDEKATIEGAGEVEIQDGINEIRIVVTAENGNVQIYTLVLETPFKQSDLVLESLEIEGVNIRNRRK